MFLVVSTKRLSFQSSSLQKLDKNCRKLAMQSMAEKVEM